MHHARMTRLGTYRIERELGRGGMGVVWLAHDPRLDRQVAIKVLIDELATDASLLSRFEREAKIVASLNHPGIAAVYALEEHDGQRLLVMEYVAGETLAKRLARGRLPLDQALAIAERIAAALAAAHAHGIVHRDLKPGNVMLAPDGQVKLLDFGLARAVSKPSAGGLPAEAANAATLATPNADIATTQHGALLGTPGYMSPEQVRGHPVDARSDVFAFGCVLFELLCGKRPFQGATIGEVVAALLAGRVDFAQLPPSTPPRVRWLLGRCLQSDREQRWRDLGDVRFLLADATYEAATPPARRTSFALMAAAGVAVAAIAGGLAWRAAGGAKPAPDVQRFEIDLQQNGVLPTRFAPAFALSPDGRRLACVLEREGAATLYVRDLATSESHPLATAPTIESPTFSPDGQWLAYFVPDNLMKVAVSGGAPLVVAKAEGGRSRGVAWGPDDMLVFAPDTQSALLRVGASGGEAQALTTLEAARKERSHRWPAFVPGHAHRIVFTVQTEEQDFDRSSVELLDVTTGVRHTLHTNATYGRVTAERWLVFAHARTLFACPLAADLLARTRDAVPVLPRLWTSAGSGAAQFALAENGVLVHASALELPLCMPVWVGFDGREEPLLPEPMKLMEPAIAPDGVRVAFQGGAGAAIEVFEPRLRGTSRVLATRYRQSMPVWSPDGRRIAFSGSSSDHFVPSLMLLTLGSDRPPERLGTGGLMEQWPSDWSRDGSAILFDEPRETTRRDIAMLRVADRSVETLVATKGDDTAARLSPDGQWIAFQSNVGGSDEIYVRRTRGDEDRLLVSAGGGTRPRWMPDGRRILYFDEREIGGARSVLVKCVRVDLQGPRPSATSPEILREIAPPVAPGQFDLHPDGTRVLVLRPADPGRAMGPRVHVALHWHAEREAARVLALPR